MAVAIFIFKEERMQVDFSFFRNFNVRFQADSEPVVQKPLGKSYAVMCFRDPSGLTSPHPCRRRQPACLEFELIFRGLKYSSTSFQVGIPFAMHFLKIWAVLPDNIPATRPGMAERRSMSHQHSTEICIQCESFFEITARDWERFETRGFSLPQRCEACRKHKVKTGYDVDYQKIRDKKKHYRMKYTDSTTGGEAWLCRPVRRVGVRQLKMQNLSCRT